MSYSIRAIGLLAVTVLLGSAVQGEVVVGNFSGGDPGEGLDLEAAPGGSFVYAVRFTSEPVPAARTVGGVDFVRELDEPGVTVTTPSGLNLVRSNNWATQPEYGATADDESLEEVLWDIYFGQSGTTLSIGAAIEPNRQYQLQLLFTENFYRGTDRSFDVVIEGVTEVDDLNIYAAGGGSKDPDPDAGVVVTYEFFSGPDTTLNIDLAATGNTSDTTPVISALTLEEVPEPGGLALGTTALLGLLWFVLRRR